MDWKRSIIATRYFATLPLRMYRNARSYAQGHAPVMILFYHRVADDHPNGWTISNALFQNQIRWIQRRFEIVSLQEAQRRLRSGVNSQPTVSITFDDGYADNCSHALPFLIRENIPYTYFVTLGNIESGAPFPHDRRAGIRLPPNSIDQIRCLAENGAEIGAHTRTHCDIGLVTNRDMLLDEIVGVKHDLERSLARPVHYFAFPYGLPESMTAEAISIARDADYSGICSAYGGYNLPGGDAFQLQRIHGDSEMLRLKNWLTFDRRKLALHPPLKEDSTPRPAIAATHHEHAAY